MSEYTPTIEERRAGAEAIERALGQCGITVQYAIAGPSELFDVASLLLKSDWLAAHDADVRKAALAEARRIVDGPHPANSGLDSFTLAWVSAALGDAPTGGE